MKTIFKKNKTRIFLAVLAIIAMPFFSGCGTTAQQSYTVNLEIWGLFDDSTVYSTIIEQYKKLNPFVGEIKYRKFSQDTYKQELIDALASGQGPDIFLINNTWFPSFENKLQPAPTPLVSELDMRSNFPDVVSADFVDNTLVYAVPLSVDSMQLYYNRDMFNAAGITAPPATWQEFSADVQKLTKVDSVGNITQAGAALGTSKNINRASDLLSMMMFQDGVEMPTKKYPLVKFDQGTISPSGGVFQAAEQALGFYTQYARLNDKSGAQNPLYTWNVRQHDSTQAFAEQSVAMMFNYSWQAATIKSTNPKLNFSVAPVPQVNQASPSTIANYWGYAVARNKVAPQVQAVAGQVAPTPIPNEVRTHEAWQFLKFLALKNSGTVTLYNAVTKNSKDFPINFDPAIVYLKKTGQPAARRDIIEIQKSDPNIGVFASGNLIAKDWYQTDPDSFSSIMNNAIDAVNSGGISFHDALLQATNRINHLPGMPGA